MTRKLEVWLRGPLENVPALLQPVAHALLQAREEVNEMMVDFPAKKLWDKPASVASAGFHLQHLTGVLDRLFTYARGEMLSEEQLSLLSVEGKAADIEIGKLVEAFNIQVEKAVQELSGIDEATLKETRGVGRNQIPSTKLGLLVHSAEHTMRHVGQLYVTIKILKAGLA